LYLDDYNDHMFVFGVPNGYEDKVNKWYSHYRELMEHMRNPYNRRADAVVSTKSTTQT
jgi:hypothetical protein